MLVISVQGSFDQAKKTILSDSRKGEVIELRLDLMEKNDFSHIAELRKLCVLPVIFALRKKTHGGNFEGNEKQREEKFLEFLRLRPDYVDIEYDSAFIEKIPSTIKKIVSYHNFEKTPENLEEILEKLKCTPAQIYKMATMAQSSLDALKMLRFVKRHKQVAGMCMGTFGRITRILSPIVDNVLTYTFSKKKIAPGQLSVSELVDIYRYYDLNCSTEIYGVIGDPIDESVGHLFHNQAFKKVKKNGVYIKVSLKPIEIPQFFSLIEGLPFVGLSVTMPLKEHIIPYLSAIDHQAKKIGAVNTLIKKHGKWFGINTDAGGALDALEKKGKVSHKKILVIGGGGAARAISLEASNRGAQVTIANRTLKKARIIACLVKGNTISINRIDTDHYDIIINATAIGMPLSAEKIVIPENKIRKNILGLDVIINPKRTKFLSSIQNKGGEVVFGYEMYAEQALRQLQAWSIIGLNNQDILSLMDLLKNTFTW